MSLVFVISLSIVPLSVFVLKNSSDEMYYLAASILLVSLLVSLLFAPWQLQLLLLIFVLLSNRRRFLPSEPLIETQDEKKTQLIYRGIKYEPTSPSVEASKGELIGKYRGHIWRVPAQSSDREGSFQFR